MGVRYSNNLVGGTRVGMLRIESGEALSIRVPILEIATLRIVGNMPLIHMNCFG
jgi:hypothetical protein